MSASLRTRIAVVGASSLIGEAVLEELRSRKFPHAELHALEDAREARRPSTESAESEAHPPKVGDVASFDFERVDLVFFCGRGALAARYAERAAERAWVIDCSSTFWGRADIPLVVAEVNAAELEETATRGHGLIALPGSASTALAIVLAPLHAAAGILRADVASYHAVSGRGRSGVDELAGETVAMLSGKKARGRAFGRQIAFNVIPQVEAVEPGGATVEERRLWEETRRVLKQEALAINATAVRVPVFFGHGLAVHALFERPIDVSTAAAVLRGAAGVSLPAAAGNPELEIPTPATVANAPDRVYVGRLRGDPTRDRALNFWIVADNVRKCAAHNAVSAAQILVNSACKI